VRCRAVRWGAGVDWPLTALSLNTTYLANVTPTLGPHHCDFDRVERRRCHDRRDRQGPRRVADGVEVVSVFAQRSDREAPRPRVPNSGSRISSDLRHTDNGFDIKSTLVTSESVDRVQCCGVGERKH
jgi:hypothetical protein